MMAELGLGGESEQTQKKRGRPPADAKDQKDPEDEDLFGAADEDWDIYRGIQRDGYSEDEEDDQ